MAGSVAGTVTSYRQAGLTPASSYQYRVVAVRGGRRSPQSAILAASTLTAPLAQARLRGSWSVAIVAESPDDQSVLFRTYCSQWPPDVCCALECNFVRGGSQDLPPRAGLGVYERGPDGLLAAARADDVEAPVKLR